MRICKRLALILGLTGAGVWALSGVALATSSTSTFEFTPSTVPKEVYKSGKLAVHTHTTYTSAGQKTDRAQLDFDNDLRIRTSGIPQCNKSSIAGNVTMAQAMSACATAKLGSGTALANAASPGDTQACVLAFNGQPSSGRPTLLLFTRVFVTGQTRNCSNPAGNTSGFTTVLLEGVIRSATGDFGSELDVNHITSVAALPLSDFRVSVKRGGYVSARCQDANRQWNLNTTFTYTNPSASQTVTDAQTCQVAQSPAAPNTKITKAKISQKRKKAKFNFRATGNATGFECQLERKRHKLKAFSSCVSPKVYKHLRKGRYTFEVRAVGPGGKDPSPAEKSFKIRRRH